MSIRNEHEIDGEQRGSREDAAWTREVYGRVMEAKGDLVMARYVRLTGLELGRVRCGWDKVRWSVYVEMSSQQKKSRLTGVYFVFLPPVRCAPWPTQLHVLQPVQGRVLLQRRVSGA